MNVMERVGTVVKPVVVPFRQAYKWGQRHFVHRAKSREELHEYWKQPWHAGNVAENYRTGHGRSKMLVDIVKPLADTNSKILEIGCNVGRNLKHLHDAGYRNLHAIEISERAIELFRETYPEVADATTIHNAPIEQVINTFQDGEFDLVFTMAVLEHIHTSSEWIFPEMVRITNRTLLTIEDERGLSWRHFPRNYRKIFEPLGVAQQAEQSCEGVEGLNASFVARTFAKKNG